ncbi:MAG: acyl-CoA thioesterase, partial [Pseudoxanthomonas sp.]
MTDQAGSSRGLVARVAISVRWGDMDAFNHVNNAQYLRYLEEARVRWLAGIPGIS